MSRSRARRVGDLSDRAMAAYLAGRRIGARYESEAAIADLPVTVLAGLLTDDERAAMAGLLPATWMARFAQGVRDGLADRG